MCTSCSLSQDFLQRPLLEAELSSFCLKFGFDLLLMMTISFTESKEPIRELAVFSHSATCREEVGSAVYDLLSPLGSADFTGSLNPPAGPLPGAGGDPPPGATSNQQQPSQRLSLSPR